MPISRVRSFTVMIMMLLMPTMPAVSVPRPTNQMNTLMPTNKPFTRLAGSATILSFGNFFSRSRTDFSCSTLVRIRM